jgi:hypothetical protein
MKAIAIWSRNNPVAARIVITCCHIALGFLACYIGLALKKLAIFLPVKIFWISVVAFFIATFMHTTFYSYSVSFGLRKLLDAPILLIGFFMIIASANQPNVNHFIFYSPLRGSFVEEKNTSTNNHKPTFKEVKKQWKELRQMIKKERASAGGIIISVLVGLLLLLLVMSASCSLACDNQGGLAIIVLIAGLAGIFFVIKLILHLLPRKQKPEAATPSS